MNLVRHELGFSQDREPLSDQGHLPCHLFALRQRRGAARARCCAGTFPWCAAWAAELKRAVRRLCRGQAARRTCSITTTCCSTGRRWSADPAARRRSRRPLRPCAGRRVPGHQPPAGLDPAGAEARRARPDRGRRRRAVDLFVPRRDRAQHPRFPARSSARRPRSSRSTATTARPSRSSPPPMP